MPFNYSRKDKFRELIFTYLVLTSDTVCVLLCLPFFLCIIGLHFLSFSLLEQGSRSVRRWLLYRRTTSGSLLLDRLSSKGGSQLVAASCHADSTLGRSESWSSGGLSFIHVVALKGLRLRGNELR